MFVAWGLPDWLAQAVAYVQIAVLPAQPPRRLAQCGDRWVGDSRITVGGWGSDVSVVILARISSLVHRRPPLLTHITPSVGRGTSCNVT